MRSRVSWLDSSLPPASTSTITLTSFPRFLLPGPKILRTEREPLPPQHCTIALYRGLQQDSGPGQHLSSPPGFWHPRAWQSGRISPNTDRSDTSG